MNGSSVIILILLAVILIPAVKKTVQHMRGEGDCCGGPKEKKVRKKIKGRATAVWTIPVSGMHCENCRNRVERKLNELPAVIARADLRRKQVTVELYEGADEASLEILIPERIDSLGFQAGSIEKKM